MKRFVALLLVLCLLVSALSVSVFAADSIVNQKWSCGFSSKSVTTTEMVNAIFDAYYSTSGFGSSHVSVVYDSSVSHSPSNYSSSSNTVLIPARSSISYSVTVSLSGLSGFGSNNPTGSLLIYTVDSTGKCKSSFVTRSGVSPSISGTTWQYTFSGSFKTNSDIYSAFIFQFLTLPMGLNGSTFAGKKIGVSVSDANIRVTSLAPVSSSSENQINNTVNNIYNTVINNNTEVIAQITNVIGVLNDLFQNSVQINAYLDSLVGEINAMGSDLDSVLSYLQQVVTTLNYLPRIYDKLDSIGLSSETIQALIDGISSSISPAAADLSNVEEYLSNTLNQINHISDVVDAISDKLDISNGWFEQFAGHLVQIDTDVGLCSSYLQGIYNTLSKFIVEDTAAMVKYLNESNTNILEVLKEVQALRRSLGDNVGNQLAEIIKNLVSQGTSIDGIKSFVSTIKENSAESVKLLGDILEELKKVEAENSETNDRLKAIQDAIDGFELNVSNAANNVLTSSDQKGLGALVSKLISHLLSVVDFVTDLFGGIFTSVPATISAYNDCNSFWGDQKTYIYTPHQISGFTEQGGASYENSNTSVRVLFSEAEKYLGYPYVFGGSSPETSFDCSGFVCYALNQSGVFSISRTTAQGLYDVCTPIDRLSALPGDLVFFTGTYDCPDTVSHVGIYAGNGRMLHCGDPIQYTSIDTSYWQSHFYSFGRLSYNNSPSVSFPKLPASVNGLICFNEGEYLNLSFESDFYFESLDIYYFDPYAVDNDESEYWSLVRTSITAEDIRDGNSFSIRVRDLPISAQASQGYPMVICAYAEQDDMTFVSLPIVIVPSAMISSFNLSSFTQKYHLSVGGLCYPTTCFPGSVLCE